MMQLQNSRPQSLRGKVVCITGASGGIGEQIAYNLSCEGANLVITYHKNMEKCEEVARACREKGAIEVMVLRLDVTDDTSIKSAVDALIRKFGKIDILINNAGVIVHKELSLQSFDEIAAQTKTNLEGMIKLTSLCVPHLTTALVNIGSNLGKTGKRNLSVYCATKFGVRGFSQALSKEYPQLRINTVNPGLTSTQMGNFKGVGPEIVAHIVCDVARDRYGIKSGMDVDTRDFTYGYRHRHIIRALRILKRGAGRVIKFARIRS